MDSLMTSEDRIALVEKINAKLTDMDDMDLKDLAKEVGVEEVVEDADKAISKDLADSIMTKPVVDTEVLTGPINGLKSFLLKSAREKDSK